MVIVVNIFVLNHIMYLFSVGWKWQWIHRPKGTQRRFRQCWLQNSTMEGMFKFQINFHLFISINFTQIEENLNSTAAYYLSTILESQNFPLNISWALVSDELSPFFHNSTFIDYRNCTKLHCSNILYRRSPLLILAL